MRVRPLPVRRLGDRLRQLGQDVRFATGRLRGRRPSPTIARPVRSHRGEPRPSRSIQPRPVEVVRVVRETPDAVSLYLREAGGAPLAFRPGQFLSFDVETGGRVHRRAYSLAHAAVPGREAHVTIKRVEGGKVSNHLNDHAAVGMRLRVLGPSGSFTLDETAEHLVLVAGGSGITPIASIAETALLAHPASRVTLIYGNRSEADIIFRERLARLADEHPERFRLAHVLEAGATDATAATAGRLDGPTLMARLEALTHADDAGTRYYVCGPSGMMDAVRTALVAAGVPTGRIREERFARPEERTSVGPELGAQRVTLRVDGRELELVTDGDTLLEAGLAAGATMPFSCAMGGCAACRVKVVEGQVVMEEPNCLTAEERAEGYVLACVGRAASPCVGEVEG